MNNEKFSELSNLEVNEIDGGSLAQAGAVFVGTIAVGLSPAAAVLCPPAGIGMALGGAGLIGKATGAY